MDDPPAMSFDARTFLRWSAFPVLIGGGVGAMIVAAERGLSLGPVFFAVMAVEVPLIAFLERVLPRFEGWNRPRRDVLTDALHSLLSSAPVAPIFEALFLGVLAVGAARLSSVVGVSLWPLGWPLAFQLALALVVAEFGQYWFHRLAHETDLLWRLHSVHHSPERLYWLNAGRFHPLDTFVQYVLHVTPVLLLGAGPEVIALFTLFTGIHGLLQHANIDVRLGPLNWIFSMAELHRWHHSRLLREANTNYGANVIFWDIVFGTRFLPADRLPPEDIGIADMPNFPGGYLAQLAVPFRWGKLKAKRDALQGEGGVRLHPVA